MLFIDKNIQIMRLIHKNAHLNNTKDGGKRRKKKEKRNRESLKVGRVIAI